MNSALQRARATLGTVTENVHPPDLSEPDPELLRRYVDAFERYDIDAFVELLHEDAGQSMPPFAMWLQGAKDIGRFMLEPAPSACKDSRLVRIDVNGCPAFGQFKAAPEGGFAPWAIQVLEISEGKIAALSFFLAFLEPERLFPAFGLPLHLDS